MEKEYEQEVEKHKDEFKKNELTIVTGYTNDFERSFVNAVEPEGAIIVRDSGINSYINMTKTEERMFLTNNLIISEYPDKVIPSLYT